MSPEAQYLCLLIRGHLARVRDDERGVSAVEWVIITGVLIALAVGIGVIITTKITNKANGISL
jgi:Flp pilus assembly pilin Flp